MEIDHDGEGEEDSNFKKPKEVQSRKRGRYA